MNYCVIVPDDGFLLSFFHHNLLSYRNGPDLIHLAFSLCFTMKRLNNGFYQSHTWRRCREAYIASVGGLCERCKEYGIITAGRVVHHIVPLTEKNYTDEKIAYNFDNLMLVCQSCHEEIHRGQKSYKFDADGNILCK